MPRLALLLLIVGLLAAHAPTEGVLRSLTDLLPSDSGWEMDPDGSDTYSDRGWEMDPNG